MNDNSGGLTATSTGNITIITEMQVGSAGRAHLELAVEHCVRSALDGPACLVWVSASLGADDLAAVQAINDSGRMLVETLDCTSSVEGT